MSDKLLARFGLAGTVGAVVAVMALTPVAASASPGAAHELHAKTGGFAVDATGDAPVFTADQPSSLALLNTAYSYRFAATGSPAPTFTLRTGQLPTGLTLGSATGLLAGKPTATGIYQFTVRAGNTAGSAHTAKIVITVGVKPVFTADQPTSSARVKKSYKYTFAASGYPSPEFSLNNGQLPPGLALSTTTGKLTGTPTAGGSYKFTVAATNAFSATKTARLTITVDQPVHWTQNHPAKTAIVGTTYSYQYQASGFPTPTYQIASGKLPNGLHLTKATGLLAGKPTKTGTFTFTVAAINAATPAGIQHTTTIKVS